MSRTQAHILIVLLAAACLLLTTVLVTMHTQSASAEVGSTDRTTADYGDESSDFVIPYDGYLMLDSTPLNGGLELRFELYEFDPSINNIATAPEWSETQTITAYNGRFSVGLGSTTPINSTLLDADQLFLSISVSDGAGGYTPLGGYQAIEPVPYAIWSAHAANLSVAGTLATGGNATLGDATTDAHTANGSLSVTNGLTVEGNTVLGQKSTDLTTTWDDLQVGNNPNINSHLIVTGTTVHLGTSNDQGHGNGGRALIQQASDTLHVNFNGEFTGGTVLDSNTTVDGTLTTAGNVTVGNHAGTNTNLTVTGTTLYLGTSNNQGQGDGGRALMVDTGGDGTTTEFLYVNRSGDFPGIRLGGDLVEVNGDIVVDGDDIDADDSQVLRLNTQTGRPVQLAVYDPSAANVPNVGSDNGADAHLSSDGASIGGVACSDTTRGALVVSTIDEGTYDALCYCAKNDQSVDQWRWVCLNP